MPNNRETSDEVDVLSNDDWQLLFRRVVSCRVADVMGRRFSVLAPAPEQLQEELEHVESIQEDRSGDKRC
jgi:hypothetical protein